MNLPSPDEQLDLHGPRAQLPFEQIPPQSRAGIKSSHEALEKDLVPLVSNGVITSGGDPYETQVNSSPAPLLSSSSTSSEKEGLKGQDESKGPLVSPLVAFTSGTRRSLSGPDGGVTSSNEKMSITHAEQTAAANNDAENEKQHHHQRQATLSPTQTMVALDDQQGERRQGSNLTTMGSPVMDQDNQGKQQPTSFLSRLASPFKKATTSAASTQGQHLRNLSGESNGSSSSTSPRPQRSLGQNIHAHEPMCQATHRRGVPVESQDGFQPPVKMSRFQNIMSIFKRFLGFVGPGYIVSVGYMDPGNWATDLAGGSSFGYMLLFVILLSNLMAVVLQGLAVKLGVVSGLDLAQACRKFTPKYINWVLYVLAELAIIACDLAEVIGSAIALKLLFKIPLPWGVVITAADVLLILFAFRDDQSVKSRRMFEALVILLVTAVGACFTAEIVYSEPVAKDVFRGFLPSLEILTNKEALYLAIGIIGATVMPHNLYLHSSIVKLRTSRELSRLASSQASMSSTSDLMTVDQRKTMLDEDKGAVSMKHSTIRSTLRYTFVDSTIALTFALYVNSAILIVSAATFKYKYPDVANDGLADFFDAFDLLSKYLGSAAGYVFAVALLMAGQSSTLTATLAGQIIMEGFLGASYLKPWVRRLLTRCLAIVPALVIVVIKGDDGLSELLLASQVALSVQLPFAVIPLVIFTSMSRCMTVPVQDNEDKPGETMAYGIQYREDVKKVIASNAASNNATTTTTDAAAEPTLAAWRPGPEDEEFHAEATAGVDGAAGGAADVNGTRSNGLLMHDFSNSWWLVLISGAISMLLLGLNFYMLVGTIKGD